MYAYTRHGAFTLDSIGRLVTADGSLVLEGIVIPRDARLVTISEYGVVNAIIYETLQQIGQFRLVEFANSDGLKPITENLFVSTVD